MCSLRKIRTRLRGTNFCTSSARLAPSFVRQPNGPECTQMVRNEPKRQFRVQWVGSDAIVAKYFDATSWQNFCTSSARFAPSFVRQPNSPDNVSLGSNGVDRVRLLPNIPTRLRGTNFCTTLARCAPRFVSQTNSIECTQIVRNAPKHQFGV